MTITREAPNPYGHKAFYHSGEPYRGPIEDTGLRCWCGREVVSCDDTTTGWAHVGVGAKDDLRTHLRMEGGRA